MRPLTASNVLAEHDYSSLYQWSGTTPILTAFSKTLTLHSTSDILDCRKANKNAIEYCAIRFRSVRCSSGSADVFCRIP